MQGQVYRDSNFVTQMSQIIDEYLYEGKYTVDTLEAFCGLTADIISQYIPLKRFVEIAEKPFQHQPPVTIPTTMTMMEPTPTTTTTISASGMNSVLLSSS